MQITSLSVDGFHPAPDAVTRIAKSLSYEVKEHDGHKYSGIGTGYQLESAASLLGSILGIVSVNIDMEYFRLGIVGESVTSFIHADSGISNFAAVLYLSESPKDVTAGTAFWKHKELGIETVPDLKWIEDHGMTVDSLVKKLQDDGNDESKWQMTGLVGQKYNRIAVYPSKIFHSRYPKEAWGKDVNDGRIVWTGFFSTY